MTTRPVALITGASRGIGAATARQLARCGYALVLAARSVADLQVFAYELSRDDCPALPLPTDLRDPADIQRLVDATLEHFGRVDVLINNAGISPSGSVGCLASDIVDATLSTNLVAPIALTRALLPGMLERRSGTIVFVTSTASYIGLPNSAIYCATKFGLRGFALGLRREVMHKGVSVAIVAPGFVDTAMTAGLRGVHKVAPAVVAQAIEHVIKRPRRELIVPRYNRLAVWLEQTAPALMDVVLHRRPW